MPETIEFRVQYIDDVDPFNVLASIKHAEPTVPKRYNFVSDLPLYDQVPSLKKYLKAPHKVGGRIIMGCNADVSLNGMNVPLLYTSLFRFIIILDTVPTLLASV